MKTITGGVKEIGYGVPSPDPEFDERIEKALQRIENKKSLFRSNLRKTNKNEKLNEEYDSLFEWFVFGIGLLIAGGILTYIKLYYWGIPILLLGAYFTYTYYKQCQIKLQEMEELE